MNKIVVTALFTFISLTTFAQTGWNWPEDEENHRKAKEKEAYYKVLMAQDQYGKALHVLQWLYNNNPNLNPSIYINGAKCTETLMEQTDDKERIARLQDSTLWMYDQRIKHFDEDASVMERKAYTAFKFFYKKPGKYELVLDLYNKAFEMNGADISNFNLVPYMTLAKFAYERKVADMTGEKILEIHGTISNILDQKEKNGEDVKKRRDKVDALLSSIEGLLTCEFIKENLVPRLEKNPEDVGTAKKIFNYSLKAKCTEEDFFMDAAEVVAQDEASFRLLKVLGDKWTGGGDPSKGMEFYERAEKLASGDEEKYELKMGQARAASKLGRKTSARNYAQQALQYKPGSGEAYNLIGNLYFYSFDDCKGGESIVKDRAVYIAAYEMYKKAGNSSRMAAAKEQFPSAEEIFNEGMSEGQTVQVNCWINTSVQLQKR